jgi:RsiW-degrading membrane proteinase PrsW (M82 family)
MMLGILWKATDENESMASKTLNIIITIFILAITISAFALAIKTSPDMSNAWTRAAWITLAVLYPDLFVLGYFIVPPDMMGQISLG